MPAVSQQMGSSPPSAWQGRMSATSVITFTLDDNFVHHTSGKAFMWRFSSPVSQTTAEFKVWAFLTTKTGSPTGIKCAVYAGPSGVMDDDRPSTDAALGTSAAVDVTAQANNSWTEFTISSLTLTAGATYWVVIYNDTATPASNHATYMTRGVLNSVVNARIPGYTTTTGYAAADPASVSAGHEICTVMKFSDGSIVGEPLTSSTTPTSNTWDRGNRYTFDASVVVSGVYMASAPPTHVKVYQGATEVASVTLDRSQTNNGGYVYFDAPVTFSPGVDYDVVVKFSGNATIYPRLHPGTSPPADVLACLPSGLKAVIGATPGSYTVEDGVRQLFLLVDNVPAGGGGGARSYTSGG